MTKESDELKVYQYYQTYLTYNSGYFIFLSLIKFAYKIKTQQTTFAMANQLKKWLSIFFLFRAMPCDQYFYNTYPWGYHGVDPKYQILVPVNSLTFSHPNSPNKFTQPTVMGNQ